MSLGWVPTRIGSLQTSTSPGPEVLDAELLDAVAHALGHRAGEEHQRCPTRRTSDSRAPAVPNDRGEVIPVAQDHAERVRHQVRAHVLDDVAEPVGEHRRGEPVAVVARLELGVGQLLQTRAGPQWLGRAVMTAPPSRSRSLRSRRSWRAGPATTCVVDIGSRMIAGPRTMLPACRSSRSIFPDLRLALLDVAELEHAVRRDLDRLAALDLRVLDLVGAAAPAARGR